MRLFRLSRLTIRARLTLVYGGLLLMAGLVLLALTYALVSNATPGEPTTTVVGTGEEGPTTTPPSVDGEPPPGAQVVTEIRGETWDDALQALLTQGAIALVIVAAAAIGLGWLIAGRMLQPLHRVTETAQRVADAPAADRGLHERIGLKGPPDEFKNLSDTFDLMLERLDRAFDGQRRFIANASHELRTPLTVNRSVLELALYRDAATPETRQLGETLLAMNDRQERLLDGLLLLARSEQEITERSYVDLADVVEHVVSQAKPESVAIRTATRSAPTLGNPVLLERLVQNLVDNGIRHNLAANGWVDVTCGAQPDGTVCVTVANTGPVVPPYDIPTIFEPFTRLETDRPSDQRGLGLGLSIVRAVASAHNGEVRAEPRAGGGLIVTVTLPAAI